MGLFNWLKPKRNVTTKVDAFLPGPGDFAVEVVGESHYQSAIEAAAGGRTEDGCEHIVDAFLILEDSNPHDSKAVQVRIDGQVCGYLSRDNARQYRMQLKAVGLPNVSARCKAKIVGGWDRGPDDRGFFGVRLDLPHEKQP